MNVCVVGTGYVGLVAGTCLSDFGMNVVCVDKVKEKIDMLNRGEVPIYELGLGELIQRNVKLDRLHFTTDLKQAVDRSLVVFLAVGTPERPDGYADLSQIEAVAKEVAGYMTEYKIIAIKSTVPVGTARRLRQMIRETASSDVEFDVVSNPEFLREGAAVNDFLRPDRVILGCDSERALAIMRDIYRPLFLLETPIVSTTNETAEVIKYASNTMLAVRISFVNEIANLCDIVGADVYQVSKALGMDKRIGPKFLHPGPGYGGSCFPKDVSALARLSEDVGYDFKLARAVIEVNARQRELAVQKAVAALGSVPGKVIGLLGLSFKPNTDDVREAPAIYIARRLMEQGATVNAFDPAAMDEAKKNIEGIKYHKNAYDAVTGADIVIIATEWNEFRDLDFRKIKSLVRTPIVYDTRNIYNPKALKEIGFKYVATGRS
ncbi:MAG: UDP-glucose/GDP-mannose dehydrogenase family protein [candidate division Zixibacteria bacterium]|jgi:UDPglucose 6-dehydrogenase|nr:UDP-glucose/GDP-mannose dehydrogenase family protein [candidate division Zixibacteria bacterium]